MGNCLSKINKGLCLNLEEYSKNKTSLEKGKIRRDLDIITGGGYTRIHSMSKYSKTLDPIQTGHGGEAFKTARDMIIFCW